MKAQAEIDFASVEASDRDRTARYRATLERALRASDTSVSRLHVEHLCHWIWHATTRRGTDKIDPIELTMDEIARRLYVGERTARRVVAAALQIGAIGRLRTGIGAYGYFATAAMIEEIAPLGSGQTPQTERTDLPDERPGWPDERPNWPDRAARMAGQSGQIGRPQYNIARARDATVTTITTFDRSIDRSRCEDDPQRGDIPAEAVTQARSHGNRILEGLHLIGPRASRVRLTDRDRREAWQVAWLMVLGLVTETDLDAALEACHAHRPRKPMAYFRVALRRQLEDRQVDFHGLERRVEFPPEPPRAPPPTAKDQDP
jgi:hypothetical protein